MSVLAGSDLAEVRQLLADRYTIERELGRGGMGAVFLARDVRLDRPVALKVLPRGYAADGSLRERFLRETRTAASFSHPNIVPVHAVEERGAVLAYAMGYVEGESLAERVKRTGALGARELVRLLQDIGYALAYAHGRGVVHRDLKPDNIMLERATGRALLMDFGIARTIAAAPVAGGLTRVGEVVGTPEYMSPEQASGDVVDGRSDLYSLGLVAWFAATGQTAMTGETTQRILVRQLTEPVPAVASVRPGLPEALGAAIDRCVAKEPSARFPTAEALVETLDEAQLAAPEVPLPVRSFAQELGATSMVLVFIAFLGWMQVQAVLQRPDSIDPLLPLVILLGVGMTRVLQVMAEGRRLAFAGFSVDEVMRGMRAVVDEREEVRDRWRGDAATRRLRRRTLWWAGGQLVMALLLLWMAYRSRVQVRPGVFSVPPHALVMLFSSMALLGVSAVLFVRSPFRMPVGERLFRVVWLRGVGRGLVRLAGRGVSPGAARPTGASRSRIAAPSVKTGQVTATPAVEEERGVTGTLQALERRVRALEDWRDGRS